VVDASTQAATELLTIPSEVVPGSVVWSPDATRAVFVAHAGVLNALCLLDLQGGIRYLADLEPGSTRPAALVTPSWSPDSRRVAYVAPRQGPPGTSVSWLRADVPRAIYTASDVETAPTFVAETDADAVAWREDGQLLTAGRQGTDGTLELRVLGDGGSNRALELPLRPRPGYGLLWDVEHARLVVANPAAGGDMEYWLASLGLEGE
jgi:Tol biopolymer transport system component